MTQHPLHSWTHRLCAALLVLCGAGSAWGQTSYRLQQVTSVHAGGLYVFEQTYNGKSYVMNNETNSSNSLKTTTSYKISGLDGTESYVWTLEKAKNGYYMRNVSLSSSPYLNNTSSTDMAFGTYTSNWAFNFQEDKTVMIQNKSNGDRFLGFQYSSGKLSTVYRAYETGTSLEPYCLRAIRVYELVESPVTLNSYGYATFSYPHPLNFTNAEANGYTAWQITGVSSDAITFEQITGAVAGGTGVFLKGTPGATPTLYVAASGTDISSTNKLIGVTSATEINDGEYYGLKGTEFVPVNAGTVPAGKALLPASVVDGSGGEVKALTFNFETATGITSLSPSEGGDDMVQGEGFMVNGSVYNLAGQRLQKPQRGVNIINGKKFIMK